MSENLEEQKLDKTFWNNRYLNKDTGWDVGIISSPLKAYIDQLHNKKLKILIPGGGNSYEAEYLFNNGFKNIYVIDISKKALENFKKRVPKFPDNQLLNQDFFTLKDSFDLILEQTFFCAIHPKLRTNYSLKMNELLTKNGKLVGLLFNFPLEIKKPPFGGEKKEYLSLFSPHFNVIQLEDCYNSIPSRKNRELFFILNKK